MKKTNYAGPLALLTTLFFMWGFITCMNDILIPYLKGVFELSYTEAILVQFAFFGAYFIGSLAYFTLSMISGDPISKIGYQNSIIIGLLISASGCALFFVAAKVHVYLVFLAGLFVLGLGFTLLQIAANPFVSLLGSEKSASSRLNMAQGFNSLGTTIAPLIGGFLVFKYFAKNSTGADAVVVPYLTLAGILAFLAIVFRFIQLPKFTNNEVIEKGLDVFKFPNLTKGMAAIFCYVGGEVAIGSILISYIGLKEIAGLEESEASVFLALYWGGLMIGRFMGAISLSTKLSGFRKYGSMLLVGLVLAFGLVGVTLYDLETASQIKEFEEVAPFFIFVAVNFIAFVIGRSLPGRTLAVFSIIAVGLLLITMLTNGAVSMWALVGVGIFNSIMWSNIFTLSIKGLEKYTAQGSSLLVLMIVGGALVPLLQTIIMDHVNIKISFLIPMFCYLYLFYFGILGHKTKNEI